MPENVVAAWVARPAAVRREVFDRWWWSLSEERRGEARVLRAGEEMPDWMWRTLDPGQRSRPSVAMVRTGQVSATMPRELYILIRQWRGSSG